jgi:hypothetical protein
MTGKGNTEGRVYSTVSESHDKAEPNQNRIFKGDR